MNDNNSYLPLKTYLQSQKLSLPNSKSTLLSQREEKADKQDMVERTTLIYRQILPPLLKNLSCISDPRQPGKVKYQIAMLMLYGILMFAFQVSSRRQANREMTHPLFLENLKALFPDIEDIPHADTLAKLLKDLEDVEQIQECMIGLLKNLIRNKKFKNHLYQHHYLIAIDGTQKHIRNYPWTSQCLRRQVGKGQEKETQYYVYVLEVLLILDNGITLPLLSEFLDNQAYANETTKQDCERKAFYRIAKKLKAIFPKSRLTIVIDGLYACGPVIHLCKENRWDYMIVLKDNCLKEVWQEARGLMKLEPGNSYECYWGDRHQTYQWANQIDYYYGENGRNRERFDVVICEEAWEVDSRLSGEPKYKKTRYAWLSGSTINQDNVFIRCTRMARYRWKIENHILVEKHDGYGYEHCLSYDWNAMKGYHYLMKIAHFINELITHSELLIERVRKVGVRQFIKDLYETLKNTELNLQKIQEVVSRKHQWRLISSEFT